MAPGQNGDKESLCKRLNNQTKIPRYNIDNNWHCTGKLDLEGREQLIVFWICNECIRDRNYYGLFVYKGKIIKLIRYSCPPGKPLIRIWSKATRRQQNSRIPSYFLRKNFKRESIPCIRRRPYSHEIYSVSWLLPDHAGFSRFRNMITLLICRNCSFALPNHGFDNPAIQVMHSRATNERFEKMSGTRLLASNLNPGAGGSECTSWLISGHVQTPFFHWLHKDLRSSGFLLEIEGPYARRVFPQANQAPNRSTSSLNKTCLCDDFSLTSALWTPF